MCSGANSISGGTFSEKAFLAGTQYFRSEKKKLEIINIKWQLDYILSWGQNDTKKHIIWHALGINSEPTNAKLFLFSAFSPLHTYSMAIPVIEFSSGVYKIGKIFA